MRLVVLVLVMAMVRGSVHASRDYPKLVSWERTDSESFVSDPNVLDEVDHIEPSEVSSANYKDPQFFTDRDSLEGLDCLNKTQRTLPRLVSVRRNLPGLFICDKSTYVIPVFEIELDRFFNVSLDFLKLLNPERIRVMRFKPLPEKISIDVGPSGIIFVSGIVRAGQGTMTLRLDFHKTQTPKKPHYRIKILFYIRSNDKELRRDQQPIEFRMKPSKRILGRILNNQELQIEAVKCAAKAVSLPPWGLHGVNSAEDFVKESFAVRAYPEFPKRFCAPDLRGPELVKCEDFSITEIKFVNGKHCREGLNKRNEVSQREANSFESEENYPNEAEIDNELQISNITFLSGSQSDATFSSATTTSATTSKSTTTPSLLLVTPTTSEPPQPPHQPLPPVVDENHDLVTDSNSKPNPVNTEGPTVKPEPQPPVTVPEKDVSKPQASIDDPKLKTAMYGMLGLAAIVVLVIFAFLFSRLGLCKKRARYDPVFMAGISDDNTKFS